MSEADVLAAAAADAGAQRSLWDPSVADWADRAMAALEHLVGAGVEFTAEDIRDRVGDPPEPNAMGAVFRSASQRRLIVPVGIRKSKRVRRHGGLGVVWRGR